MIVLMILAVLFCCFAALNYFTKQTTTYRNFYRSIHCVKDVGKKKYRMGVFGSTFAYYDFDLKEYGGHNFSIEPQSVTYMKKTVRHFLDNIEDGGIVLLSLAGCFFAADSVKPDEECLTYYSFLDVSEFDNFRKEKLFKYYLKRYFPASSPTLVKKVLKDDARSYSSGKPVAGDAASAQAKKRIAGWERALSRTITDGFKCDAGLLEVLARTIKVMRDIIDMVRRNGKTPVFVILPMSSAFNAVCPREFYDEVLYRSLVMLEEKAVHTLDYLYDAELSDLTYYASADCLNSEGRRIFTKRLVEDLDSLVL